MVFCHDEETVNELTDSTLCYEMVKDLSTAKGTDDVSESNDKWYEEVVTNMQDYFSKELPNMEKNTDFLDFSGFESNSD